MSILQLKSFRVANFRNIDDSGWIDVLDLTAIIGPNESGKSNLCEALFRLNPYDEKTSFDLNFDWPVDKWEKKDKDEVCIQAKFVLTDEQREEYLNTSRKAPENEGDKQPSRPQFANSENEITLSRKYSGEYLVNYALKGDFESDAAWNWILKSIPKFVYVDDYGATGTQVELNVLAQKIQEQGWNALSPQEQTIKIILDLAKIDIDDFLSKGASAEGRTLRTFDKKNASAYLSRKFQDLWKQKKVDFDIEIDNTTLNILVKDEGLHMPVPLNRRSTGFRWYVAFAWRFTHATSGDFANTVLLLEEPGIHLHPAAQADLLRIFETLSESNQLIYTTHLPSLVDPGYPERIRIVELENHKSKVTTGLVTTSRSPMLVIEASLGLSPEMSGLLGRRKTLIVEGQDDSTILWKLSKLFDDADKPAIPEDVFIWPAQGAQKSPMYAGFLLGHHWKGGCLLDGDEEGKAAKSKIKKLYKFEENDFFCADLSQALGTPGDVVTIENVLGVDFYLNAVADAYRLKLEKADLDPNEALSLVRRIDAALKARGLSGLDKGFVMTVVFKHFAAWKKLDDLPKDTKAAAGKLFAYLADRLSKLEPKSATTKAAE